MFPRLRVEADVDVLDSAVLLAHVAQEGVSDVVVEVGDGDLLWGQLSDVVFVILRSNGKLSFKAVDTIGNYTK